MKQQCTIGWAKNINYPVINSENNIQGRVVCQFVVGRNGEIEDVKVVRGVDPSLDKEAIRVIKAMPKWILVNKEEMR